ncbi:terminase gpA endonuclease subunit [Rhodopseudomonas faecalis]|uniref:terminase gpA endonuclease subunit n=1 Tax=Rhodopseudomonas faecalis TaxID=99655 RepID=UPI0024C05790|nr:terminase gpA endonuclease subunit [Rhodopseudomonas faecalis]
MPGRRDPHLTPYTVAFGRAAMIGAAKRAVLVCGAQMGKTDTELDLIGCKLDTQPAPILYAGPSLDFIRDQFEPRLNELFDQSATLSLKVTRGKSNRKTRKLVAGVPVRLAHAGSSTALKSDPAALAIVDEYDEMLANVRKQGDPLGLIEARGHTYADFVAVVSSTPSVGAVETEIDQKSGLEFWKVAAATDLFSPIWRLWQEGTRYHWTWRCPHCGGWFIPRLKLLRWPKNATPAEALRSAYIAAPCCGGVVEERHKAALNAQGIYVAPGQTINDLGEVEGAPPESSTVSFWVSGLCSPFRTIGQRAEAYLQALASGENPKIQTAVNADFGELWTPTGADTPDWAEVAALRLPYQAGDVPDGVVFLTAGIDVGARRLHYVIRGWGSRQESWLIEHGVLWGDTHLPHVWDDLAGLLANNYGGLTIRKAFVDAGFRPGRKDNVPVHMVYEFCRKHQRIALPSKGYDHRDAPVSLSRIEVVPSGKKAKYGLDLALLDTDMLKSFVHGRILWDAASPGGWHIPEDATDEYCKQVVAESRVPKPKGGFMWVRTGENHYLDCEAMAYGAAYLLRVFMLRDGAKRPKPPAPPPKPTSATIPAAAPPRGLAGLARLNQMGR